MSNEDRLFEEVGTKIMRHCGELMTKNHKLRYKLRSFASWSLSVLACCVVTLAIAAIVFCATFGAIEIARKAF